MTYMISDVEQAVCRRFQLTKEDLRSQSRRRVFARPRQIAMYLCRELTKASYPKIGRYFGDRDHTTIIHGRRRIAQLLRETNTMAGDVEGVREILQLLPTEKSRVREYAAQPMVVRG